MTAVLVILVLVALGALGFLAYLKVPRFHWWMAESIVRRTTIRPFSRGWYHILIDWCGAECSQVERALGSIHSARPEAWIQEWTTIAREFEGLADEAAAAGHRISARDHYLRACTYYRISDLVLQVDVPAKREAYANCRRTYTRAGEFFDPPMEVVEIPFHRSDDGANPIPQVMRAYLCRPPGVERPPVVVVIPGLSMVKEKGDYPIDRLVERGLATLSIDLPGQGDNRDLLPLGPDAHLVAMEAFAWLRTRPDVDGTRIAILGTSTGAALALRAVARDGKVNALVDMAGFCELEHFFHQLPPNIMQCAHYAMGTDDLETVGRVVRESSLLGDLPHITCPVLIVHGERDQIVPYAQSQLIATNLRAPHEVFSYPHGDHACTNMPGVHGRVADWLAKQLGVPQAPHPAAERDLRVAPEAVREG